MGCPKNQATFDHVTNYTRKLEKKVTRHWHGHTIPAYLGNDGRKGPIMDLIDQKAPLNNSLWMEDMENLSAKEGIVKFILIHQGHNPELCYQLQQVHDTMCLDCWESGFETIAARWNLKFHNPIKDGQVTAFATYVKVNVPSGQTDEIHERIEAKCESIFSQLHAHLCESFPGAEINIGGHIKKEEPKTLELLTTN